MPSPAFLLSYSCRRRPPPSLHRRRQHSSLSPPPPSQYPARPPPTSVPAYNALIRAHSRGSHPEDAVDFYNDSRRRGFLPDHLTFPFALKACARMSILDKGEELHCSSVVLGLDFDLFVQNCLICMYSACGSVGSAKKVFDGMGVDVRDVVSWNSMISGCLQNGRCGDAMRVFEKMWGSFGHVFPNEVTAVSVLTACARVGDFEFGRKVHALVVVAGMPIDCYLGAALIDLYVKCGRIVNARRVFDYVSERNVVSWTSMIAGYSQSCSYREAVELFRRMQVDGVKADSATLACVISACGHLGALDLGRWIHAYCRRIGLALNLTLKNSLIDMYCKCGEIDEAMEIFDGLVLRDVFSWTVMISGLALNGKCMDALRLFKQMELTAEVEPNEVTFLGLLNACSHGGLVHEGRYYFNSMKAKYNLAPRIEHYGCMVDLLGRANLLLDAESFISAMPIEPDVVIWRSFLFACRNNKSIRLAEFATQKILELEPMKCGAHVLLSNIYAASSRWMDVKRVRKKMKHDGIQKQAACSFIEINGSVHEFLAGDESHPLIETIYFIVLQINQFLRSEGYIVSSPPFSDTKHSNLLHTSSPCTSSSACLVQ